MTRLSPERRQELARRARDVVDSPPDPAPSSWPEWSWEALGDRWYPQRITSTGTVYLIADCFEGGGEWGTIPPTLAPFIAAANPAVVLALLADSEALDRVRDLHRGVEVSDELEFDGLLCAACSTPWPCATRQAIREVTGG